MDESNNWQIPGSWVEIYENIFVPAMMAEWAPRLVALANLLPGEHILDVACGTGALARNAAGTLGRRGRIIGLDISADMLAVARSIPADDGNAAPIEWREGDMGALPFADETFDVVFCAFGLMFFPDRVAALKKMRRVLKPGGCMALAVWGAIIGKETDEKTRANIIEEVSGALQPYVGAEGLVYPIEAILARGRK